MNGKGIGNIGQLVYLCPMRLDFQLIVDPTFQGPVPNAVAFETGASIAQLLESETPVYEHHGPEFGPIAPGALTRFFEDLLLGRPMPLTFAVRQIGDVDTVMAAALFMRRDLVTHPKAPGMVAGIDLVHRYGLTCLGHLDSDLGRFLGFLRGYLAKTLGKKETGTRLAQAIDWISGYMHNGTLPHSGVGWPSVRVVDRGTNGFVLAETDGSLLEGWVELYREGFLQGVLVGPVNGESRRKVVASKKSLFIPLDLGKAASILNEMERAMGELPEWRVEGALWLHGSDDGTLILLRHLMEVLLRV
jgi:hypothetical protein